MDFVSIIIPAYNEELRLKRSLEKIIRHMAKRYRYEILVVDDGSTDATVKIAKAFSKVKVLGNPGNRGKGYSVKHGMLKAKGDFLLFSDADLSTPIRELDRFMKESKNGFDVVIGSRDIKGSKRVIDQSKLRKALGWMYRNIRRLLTGLREIDSQCGFKLFTKESAKKIFAKQTIDGFGFDVELLFLAHKLGYKVKELPVTWLNAEGSKVHPIKDPLRMLRDICIIKWNSIRSVYS